MHQISTISLRWVVVPVGPSRPESGRPVDEHVAVGVETGVERLGEPVGRDLRLGTLRERELANTVLEQLVIGDGQLAITVGDEAPEVGACRLAAGLSLLEDKYLAGGHRGNAVLGVGEDDT